MKSTDIKSKKTVFKIGDRVRIINPEIFIRCGYSLTKEIAKNTLITKEEKDKIASLVGGVLDLRALGLDSFGYDFGGSNTKLKVFDKILDELAYYKLVQNSFGGNERKIHTEFNPKLKDQICVVDSKKVYRTGIYHNASTYSGWEGGYDYTPAYLENVKSHVILDVYCETPGLEINYYNLRIEDKNVEKV